MRYMKIVFASDSFKGSLSSAETAELLTKAAKEVFGNAECVAVPIADGGEGTVNALIAALRSRGYIQAKEGMALGDKEAIAPGDKEALDCADAGDGAGLITVTVHGPLMEEIMEKTWDYVDGKTEVFTDTPLHLKGKLQKMSLEMKNYYQKSLDYFGITSADRDIHYYVIDCTDSRLLAILITAFFFVVAIPMLISFITGRARARRAAIAAEEAAEMGYPSSGTYSSYGAGIDDRE